MVDYNEVALKDCFHAGLDEPVQWSQGSPGPVVSSPVALVIPILVTSSPVVLGLVVPSLVVPVVQCSSVMAMDAVPRPLVSVTESVPLSSLATAKKPFYAPLPWKPYQPLLTW